MKRAFAYLLLIALVLSGLGVGAVLAQGLFNNFRLLGMHANKHDNRYWVGVIVPNPNTCRRTTTIRTSWQSRFGGQMQVI